jgi:hypothetical protein
LKNDKGEPMGKTDLIPLLTYFSKAEADERKLKAKQAGLSISNYNRNELGYTILKQGKPKKLIAEIDVQNETENSFSFEADDEFLEILPTEIEVENAFEEIMDIQNTGEETNYFLSSTGNNEMQPSLF